MNTRETALHCALLWLGLAGSTLAWDVARRMDAESPGTVMNGTTATNMRAGLGTRGVDATSRGTMATRMPAGRGFAGNCEPRPPRAVRCGDPLVGPRSNR
jgi:hypothetical protein